MVEMRSKSYMQRTGKRLDVTGGGGWNSQACGVWRGKSRGAKKSRAVRFSGALDEWRLARFLWFEGKEEGGGG